MRFTCGRLLRRRLPTVSALSRARRPTSGHTMGIRIPLHYTTHVRRLRQAEAWSFRFVAIRTKCIRPLGGADAFAVCHPGSGQPIVTKCGGDPLPQDTDEDCWYWTSTEVKGQQTAKAWLYSLGQRRNAGDTEDTGAPGATDYHTEQVGTKSGKRQNNGRKQRTTRVLQDISCGHLYLRSIRVLRVCHRPRPCSTTGAEY